MKKYVFEVYSKEQNVTVKLTMSGNNLSEVERRLGELVGKEDVIIGVVNDNSDSSSS